MMVCLHVVKQEAPAICEWCDSVHVYHKEAIKLLTMKQRSRRPSHTVVAKILYSTVLPTSTVSAPLMTSGQLRSSPCRYGCSDSTTHLRSETVSSGEYDGPSGSLVRDKCQRVTGGNRVDTAITNGRMNTRRDLHPPKISSSYANSRARTR